LAASTGARLEQANDDEILWQHWVIRVLEELSVTSVDISPLQWELFFAGLATCLQEPGASFRLERLTGMDCKWLNPRLGSPDDPNSYTPSLKTILKFCYACNVTPLQIMSNQLSSIKALIEKRGAFQSARLRQRVPNRIDRQKCLELFQAIFDGREEPVSLCQLAKRLGYGRRALANHFPQECALLIKRTREYRKLQQEQQRYQIGAQIRQTVMTLHAQGIYPSLRKVKSILPTGWMRRPEARTTWRQALRELGL